MIEPVLLTLVGALMIAGAVYDAATLTIPNWISLLLVALFPLVAFVGGASWADAGVHAAVGFGALLVGMCLFAGGLIGGGDAKLFAAIALYVGASAFGLFVFAVAVAGGALALALIVARWGAGFVGRWGVSFIALKPLTQLQHLVRAGVGIPYGIAIAAGGLYALPAARLFIGVAH